MVVRTMIEFIGKDLSMNLQDLSLVHGDYPNQNSFDTLVNLNIHMLCVYNPYFILFL